MATILTWYQSGGPFMLPLALVGVAGLILLVERVRHIVLRSRIRERPFMERVISLVHADKLDEALQLCAEHHSTLPDLGLVLLRSRTNDEGALHNVAEAATLSVIPGLRARLPWLQLLATVSILLGIVGGIANLHDALMRAAGGSPSADATLLAGLAYALRPLGAGILMAIPLLAGHAYLEAEAQQIVAQIEEFSARLVNALIDRPDVRLGHR
jgi:biopolymer transport protein ExbB